jgi:hypothetical protein
LVNKRLSKINEAQPAMQKLFLRFVINFVAGYGMRQLI